MKRCSRKTKGWLVALAMLVAGSVGAVETSVWQVGTFSDFLQGHFNGVAINENGELGLAPETSAIFTPEAELALSLAADREHRFYVGTGHEGKVFRVEADGHASLLLTAPEPDIFALAVGPDGDLYVGSSPEGKIYRVTPGGKSSIFYDPHSKYIWALIFDPQGNLYAGTGDEGRIFKIDPQGKGKVFYDSDQTHIMCMAFDRGGQLLAGSVPNGLIYRIDPQGKAFVIDQADLPEIHDIETDQEGRIFAAALGGGPMQPIPGILRPGTPAITTPTQVMTVTVTANTPASAEGTSKGGKEKAAAKNEKQPAPKGPSFIRPNPSGAALPSNPGERSRGEVIEILPDSTVETLWSSNEASPYGLALRDGQVLFSTDSNGEVFELNPADHGQDLRLIGETHESVVSRLLLQNQALYLVTSNAARLFRMEFMQGHAGTYESSVKDTGFISRWGHVTWQGAFPRGTGVDFYTRTGNSGRPDSTWSDWAGPMKDPAGSGITSPAARYIQWKAVLHGSGSASPLLDEVSVSYLNQNAPPVFRSLNVSTGKEQGGASGPGASAASAIEAAAAAAVAANFGTANVTPAAPSPTPLTISWQAYDPNGDTLVYSIYVKSADEAAWHLLKKNLSAPNFTIEPHTLPDGAYQAKVVASDLPSNPPALAMTAEMVSAPFWVDNTPPSVTATGQGTEGGETTVHFDARDPVSPIVSAAYRLDAGEWTEAAPESGIADSVQEKFAVRLSGLSAGEHVVTFRAYDSAGNAGLGKAVIEISRSAKPKR